MNIYRKTDAAVKKAPDILNKAEKMLKKEGLRYSKLLFRAENVRLRGTPDLSDAVKALPRFSDHLKLLPGRFAVSVYIDNCTDEWKPLPSDNNEKTSVSVKELNDLYEYIEKKKLYRSFSVCFFDLRGNDLKSFDYNDDSILFNFDGTGNFIEYVTSPLPIVPASSLTFTFFPEEDEVYYTVMDVFEEKTSLTDILVNDLGGVIINTSDYVSKTPDSIMKQKEIEANAAEDLDKARISLAHLSNADQDMNMSMGTFLMEKRCYAIEPTIKKAADKASYKQTVQSDEKLVFAKTDKSNTLIEVTFIKNNSKGRLDTFVTVKGMGFSYHLPSCCFAPSCNKDVYDFAVGLFDTATESCEVYLESMIKALPSTPQWYIDSINKKIEEK